MATVECIICGSKVEVSKLDAEWQVPKICPDCIKRNKINEDLRNRNIESEELEMVGDDVFIDILRIRGYKGTLRKTTIINI